MRTELKTLALLVVLLGGCEPEKQAQPAVCRRYVECVDATGTLTRNTSTYDRFGECWSGSPERAISCTAACAQALKDLNETSGVCL